MDMTPIGLVDSARTEPLDDDWDSVAAAISLDPQQFTAEAVWGLQDFSHIEVVYVFDRVALQVDAMPTSQPILARLGFVELATTTPYRCR
jgi:tRNA (Thr-GGU) A37 N-methylase